MCIRDRNSVEALFEKYTKKELQFTFEFLLLLIVRINILISKKGSDSADFYCNVVKFEISRIALNQGFYRILTCSESLFHFCKTK